VDWVSGVWFVFPANGSELAVSAKGEIIVEPAFSCIARHALRNKPEEGL
jgi:hypothetical protein